MKIKTALIFLSLKCFIFSETLYVPENYSTIQLAINASLDFDTVLVSPGFYEENINYNGKNIVVTSTYLQDQDSSLIAQTIIDGDQDGSVAIFENNENGDAVLQGFTIQNGNGYFADPDGNGTFYTYGGGIYCQDSDPTLKDLVITNNSGDEGGGGGVFLYEASPTIIGCFITNNTTDDVGGGLYARFSSVSIINTKFIANEADLGSGCYLRNESIPTMTNVDFISNVAANSGGGVLLKDNADAVMYNVKIVNNLAEGLGGGLYVNNADPNLDFALIALNTSSAGGGVYIRNNSDPIFKNLTVAYNSSGFDGGGVYLRDDSNLLVSNSIFWENGDSQFYFRDSGDEVELDISYSLVQNNQDGVDDNDNGDLNWGLGMLSGDPYFCNGEGGDYTVRENSNVLNGGSDGDLVGFLGVGCGPINTGPVWYVSELGNDSSDGSLETPLATIQAAINASANGDTIRLFEGEYIELFDFQSKQLVLESRSDELQDSLLVEQTVISAGPLGGSCIELIGVDAANATIKNLTFSGGQSQIGGGVYVENSTPKLVGIIIKGNSAEVGGGLYINQSNIEVIDTKIYDNGSNFGGGIYATGSIVRLNNVSIDSNLAYWGAGIYSEDSNVDITDSELLTNQALIEGGAIYQNGNSIVLTKTAVTNNTGLDFGGALVCYNGLLDIQGSTVAGNTANYGSALNIRESAIIIKNSIFWANGENSFYSAAGNESSMVTVEYSNFYGGEEYLSLSSSIILNWGFGNFNSDPMFCAPGQGDFTLQENSFCLTASDSSGLIGAYEQTCIEQLNILKSDLPQNFSLFQNYPNPFNPITTISFRIDKPQKINLSVYSINGALIKQLINDYVPAGAHNIVWNGLGQNGTIVPSGLYIYKISSSQKSIQKKMVFAK